MINIKDKPIEEKVNIIANVIKDYARHKFTQSILDSIKPKGWQDIFWFVKNTLKYKTEASGKDVLYEPPEALGKVTVDCEDFTTLLGSLLLASGYPVRLKIISDGTYHIYPEVGLPAEKPSKWIGLDATTGLVGEVIYPPNYKPFLVKPLMGVTRTFKEEKAIEITLDTPVNPGDHLRFHYVARTWIPDFIEKWFYEKITTIRHPYFKILSIKKENDEWIIDVEVTKSYELGAIVTAAIIAGALAIGAIATYFSLKKVEKIIISTGKTPISLFAIAILLFGIASVVKEVKER